ncbi:MAG: glycosyltransferase family 4 protein, partial [Isosphaeraceae bacterium]
MRIMIVHSYYSGVEPSGENALVADHVSAFKRAGHEVGLVAQRTDERETSPFYPIEAALTVASGFGRSPLLEIADFRPDIVHVHNLFPNFGRRWVKEVDVPIVHTLHNFRPLCAASTLFRDGQVCTQCPDGDRWAGLRFGCYRGSPAKTLPLALANYRGPAIDPLLKRAAVLVVLSERAREIYRRAGVPSKKLVCIP